MARRLLAVVALVALLLAPAAAAEARRATPATEAPSTVPAPPPLPKAWVLVDADTGAILDGGSPHTPLRVASVFKVLTAIVVEENLPPASDVSISARAAGMPARKINVKEGQVWNSDDLLNALLLASANDAAVALAEKTGGSLESFGTMLDRTAARLGMNDPDVLHDPAGLDDEFSVDGGNLISARDLAIATRTFLSYPRLASIVASPIYRFHGPDGNDHHVVNHNLFMKLYPGAIGVKTGYTQKAGHSLIAAAQRDGRTMIAVVVGAADPNRSAAALMDKGFATPVAAEGADLERLPPVSHGNASDPADAAAPPPPRAVSTPKRAEAASSTVPKHLRDWALLALGGIPAIFILARRRNRIARPTPGQTVDLRADPDHTGTPAYSRWRQQRASKLPDRH